MIRKLVMLLISGAMIATAGCAKKRNLGPGGVIPVKDIPARSNPNIPGPTGESGFPHNGKWMNCKDDSTINGYWTARRTVEIDRNRMIYRLELFTGPNCSGTKKEHVLDYSYFTATETDAENHKYAVTYDNDGWGGEDEISTDYYGSFLTFWSENDSIQYNVQQ